MTLEEQLLFLGAACVTAYASLNANMFIHYTESVRQQRREINEYIGKEIRACEGAMRVCCTQKWHEGLDEIKDDGDLVKFFADNSDGRNDLTTSLSQLKDPSYFAAQIAKLKKEKKKDIKPWQVLLFGVFYGLRGDLHLVIPRLYDDFELELKKLSLKYTQRPLTAEEMKSYVDSGFVGSTSSQ